MSILAPTAFTLNIQEENMSIKSLTVVLDDDGREICILFRNLDGDLNGHGDYLRRVLRGHVITRTFCVKEHRKAAVSMGQLAVLLIREFRYSIGLLELKPCGTRGLGEEFVYTVYPRHASPNFLSLLNLKVETYFPLQSENDLPAKQTTTVIYDGPLDEFDANHVQSQWECREEEVDILVDRQIEMARSAKAC